MTILYHTQTSLKKIIYFNFHPPSFPVNQLFIQKKSVKIIHLPLNIDAHSDQSLVDLKQNLLVFYSIIAIENCLVCFDRFSKFNDILVSYVIKLPFENICINLHINYIDVFILFSNISSNKYSIEFIKSIIFH